MGASVYMQVKDEGFHLYQEHCKYHSQFLIDSDVIFTSHCAHCGQQPQCASSKGLLHLEQGIILLWTNTDTDYSISKDGLILVLSLPSSRWI